MADKNSCNLKKAIKRLLKNWNNLAADTQIPERTDTKKTKETVVTESFFGESIMNDKIYSYARPFSHDQQSHFLTLL